MRIGVPREIMESENRVALTPVGVSALREAGHAVVIEKGAGEGSSISDDAYREVGARIEPDADEVWGGADLVLKVKEPLSPEFHRMRAGLTLFTYLHLAAAQAATQALLDSGMTAIAYETVELDDGTLPLLYPMSEVAGCLAPQVGAMQLLKPNGGRGVLMGGIGGVAQAKVIVIGAGTAGQCAAAIACGMGADVTVLDTDITKLRNLGWHLHGKVRQNYSSRLAIEQAITDADLVIGAVLITGARAPKLVTNEMVAGMKPGSVLVDIAIDQGGCFEDSRPTTHSSPVYQVHGSLFYCVANMPGSVPHTSTYALTNATLPYIMKLANLGWRQALSEDPALARGLNTHAGELTHPGVAAAYGRECVTVGAAR